MIARLLSALFGKPAPRKTVKAWDCTWTRAELRANARAYR